MAISTVTSKFQTTIPREVRDRLGVNISSELKWEVRDGCVVVTVARPAFLARGATISDGPDPVEAVRTMRGRRGEA
jgi:bifunctional DNA-binding transcriptional regulator/antitoxin component of YhaV-PrlF toxin-antitoxin module